MRDQLVVRSEKTCESWLTLLLFCLFILSACTLLFVYSILPPSCLWVVDTCSSLSDDFPAPRASIKCPAYLFF